MTALVRAEPGLGRVWFATAQLVRFAWLEAQCCLFAGALFVGLALSRAVPLPVPRYDALLGYAASHPRANAIERA